METDQIRKLARARVVAMVELLRHVAPNVRVIPCEITDRWLLEQDVIRFVQLRKGIGLCYHPGRVMAVDELVLRDFAIVALGCHLAGRRTPAPATTALSTGPGKIGVA
jgi:hypothetical protein